MHIGINCGFSDPVSHIFPRFAECGITFVRQESRAKPTRTTPEKMQVLLEEFRLPTAPKLLWLIPLALVGDDLSLMLEACDAIAASGLEEKGAHVEIGNEPNLDWSGQDGLENIEKNPGRYFDLLMVCYERIRRVSGIPILAGAISNLTRDPLKWLEGTRPQDWPSDVHCSFHRYPREDWPGAGAMTPHKGFASREQEMDRLRTIVGNRPLWCTEVGYHTAKRDVALWTERWSDEDVAREVTTELEFQEGQGVQGVFLYQWGDGPNPDEISDTFGVQRTDGTLKPVAAAMRAFAQRA